MTQQRIRLPHHRHDHLVIGWTEFVAFPDWDIRGLQAKIDTGARTSALHVEDLTTIDDGRVLFHVMLSRKNRERRVEVTAPIKRWGRVRSSTGQYRRRCFVETQLRIGPIEKKIELSLVSREDMIFRMLLGRAALAHDFLVDASRRRLLGDARMYEDR